MRSETGLGRREGAPGAPLGFASRRTTTGGEADGGRRDARPGARAAARAGDLPAPGGVPGAGGLLGPVGLRRGRARTPRASGPSRPRRCTGTEKWDQVLDGSNPPFAKWFVGGKLNVSYNCLDRHVEAGLRRRASPSTGAARRARSATSPTPRCYADVQRFANALKDRGIGAGDVVGIFLPMIPEVAVAMLACARIGAVAQRRLRRLLAGVGRASGWSSPRRRR